MEEVKAAMNNNIEKLLTRGEKFEDLSSDLATENLRNASVQFKFKKSAGSSLKSSIMSHIPILSRRKSSALQSSYTAYKESSEELLG